MASDDRRVDTKYFTDRFAAKGLSLRKAANLLTVDHANLSVILRGVAGRYASIDLVCDLARLFGVPVEEVTRRLGYDVPRESSAKVHLVGLAGADGRVEPLSRRAGGSVDRPRGAPDDMVTVKLDSGWVCYFIPSASIAPEAVGRLSWVRTVDGEEFVGVLEKGRDRGKWTVGSVAGLSVRAAVPVEWIKC